MASLTFIALAVAWVAYANGANDNFKGVATLFGSGTTGYRRALSWGTLTTLAGSVTALFLAAALVRTFTGAGLVPESLVGSPNFVLAVAVGTAGTVFLATLLSFPVSTTHALTGSLVGAGLVLAGEVRLSVLGSSFLLPLIASPALAIALTAILFPLLRWARIRLGIRRESCVCVEERWIPVSMAGSTATAAAVSELRIGTCQERYQGALLSISAHEALNLSHFLSAGAVSFARGLNDTPKIVALFVAARVLNLTGAMAIVGLAMALGAVLQARRVAETMSLKITGMNHGQGLTANLVTAGVVILASKFGMPVSTTHVSCGSLFGLGWVTGQARWKMIASICLAWISTLPFAALVAAVAAVSL